MKFVMIAIVVAFLACACADVSELTDDGYNYQAPAATTPARNYIPPAATAATTAAPTAEYVPPAEANEQPAADGYRYKTVRRRVFRHRA